MASTFFVERLPFETAESCLRSLMKQDEVVSVSFRDAPAGTVARLEMRTVEAAERAMALLGRVKLGEGPLLVAAAEMPRAEQLTRLFAESERDGQRACGTRRAYTACVLLVDDEPTSLHAVQRLLSMHLPEVCVHFAGSGEAALMLNRTREFDAVITDVQMPGLDGFSFVVENARIKPGTPVVLMTGNPHLLALMVGSSAFAFLRKPVHRQSCVAALQHAIAYHALNRLVRKAQHGGEDCDQAQAGLDRLAQAEREESMRRWNLACDQVVA